MMAPVLKLVEVFSTCVTQCGTVLPLSARVDLLLFLLGLKQCVRTRPTGEAQPLYTWGELYNLYVCVDSENFVYISHSEQVAEKVRSVDRSYEPHEVELGTLLGYPRCCTEKIAEVGEMGIDAYEASLIKQEFPEEFVLINPAKYYAGGAYISHVPCCTTCRPSLEQARIVRDCVQANKMRLSFATWEEVHD